MNGHKVGAVFTVLGTLMVTSALSSLVEGRHGILMYLVAILVFTIAISGGSAARKLWIAGRDQRPKE